MAKQIELHVNKGQIQSGEAEGKMKITMT